MPYAGPYFPFRRNNRKPNGMWDAPDATDENIKGTSVDPHEPLWPRWKQKPPPHGEGEFVSEEPFFDIDEISQRAEFYPPGRPLVDKNINGNPSTRQRVGDMPGGNFWRRRLLLGRGQEGEIYPESSEHGGPMAADTRMLHMTGTAPSQSRPHRAHKRQRRRQTSTKGSSLPRVPVNFGSRACTWASATPS